MLTEKENKREKYIQFSLLNSQCTFTEKIILLLFYYYY